MKQIIQKTTQRLHHQRSRWMLVRHRTVMYLWDWLAFALSFYWAFELRFDGQIPAPYRRSMGVVIGIWTVSLALAFIVTRSDRGNWRYTSFHELTRLLAAALLGGLIGVITTTYLFGPWGVPHSVIVMGLLLSSAMTAGMRFLARSWIALRRKDATRSGKKRLLIYGAGAAGITLLSEINQNPALNYDVAGFIDDDPSKFGLYLRGRPVLGTGESLAENVQKHTIKKILIAIPSATGEQMAHIVQNILGAEVEYQTVPGLGELVQGVNLRNQIRPISVDDLLGRQPVQLDMESITNELAGKIVMVTGAAGSIGSELCRQIATFRPLAIVGFDQAESPLFLLGRNMEHNFPTITFHSEIGSVTRPRDLERAIKRHRPSVIFHAAAYKHVPMMEEHVQAAVETNILGTWNTALMAAKFGVQGFVMISTDKAIRPSSVMGASKRVAELIVRSLQKEFQTRYVSVRFGNVLGSNGSVIPIFREQIAHGGPVTITHPDATRYFMTISEAVQLVLQAYSYRKLSEIFVLDMGEPVKIIDMAKNLILLSGLRPDEDIELRFTGLRPGEKLHEEVYMDDEFLVKTPHPKIKGYVTGSGLSMRQVKELLDEFDTLLSGHHSIHQVIPLLQRFIPDYGPRANILTNVNGPSASRAPEEAMSHHLSVPSATFYEPREDDSVRMKSN